MTLAVALTFLYFFGSTLFLAIAIIWEATPCALVTMTLGWPIILPVAMVRGLIEIVRGEA